VGELLQQEISYLFTREMKDPRLEWVTVTRVEITDDLKHARIYISAYQQDSNRMETLRALKGATGFIRGQLGKKLKLKQVPQLIFKIDDSAEYSIKISKMLKELGVKE
jgi:ribosome-binding factor A